MTTGREECAGMLARLAELIQLYKDPEAKEILVEAQALLQNAIATASETEAVAVVRLFHYYAEVLRARALAVVEVRQYFLKVKAQEEEIRKILQKKRSDR